MKKLLFILLLFISCTKEEPEIYYAYRVSGSSGSYSVTIENAYGDTQQWNPVGNDWSYEWTQAGTRWLYVSAQNNNESGSVTVEIVRGGQVVKTNTSYGGFTIATVSGTY